MATTEYEERIRQLEQMLKDQKYQMGLIVDQLATAQQAILVLTGGATG